jgi:serine/threonine protein kinase
MSPEQAQGMGVDHRSDVWSMGCVLYEMVSGQRPFLGQYDQALLYEIVHEEAAPLTSIRAGVPMELEFITGKCLAKDAADRHQHASDIAVDLRTLGDKLRSGRSTILRTASGTVAAPTTANAAHTLNPALAPPPAKSLRMWQALAAAATLIAVSSPSSSPPRGLRRLIPIRGASGGSPFLTQTSPERLFRQTVETSRSWHLLPMEPTACGCGLLRTKRHGSCPVPEASLRG